MDRAPSRAPKPTYPFPLAMEPVSLRLYRLAVALGVPLKVARIRDERGELHEINELRKKYLERAQAARA